jgi:hypothetical protein
MLLFKVILIKRIKQLLENLTKNLIFINEVGDKIFNIIYFFLFLLVRFLFIFRISNNF